MEKRRILLVGERSLDEHGYAYADSFYDILRLQGHSVLSIDGTHVSKDLFGRKRRAELTRVERYLFDRRFNTYLLNVAQAYRPDVCFVIKGDTIKAATISAVKKATGCKWVLLYPDNPFMLSNGNSNSEVIRSLEHCDVVLSWAQMLIPVFKSLGVEHACHVPFGYDERFFTHKKTGEETLDVGFVGTADDERVGILVELMARLPYVSFGIWGNKWEEYIRQAPILAQAYKGPAVYKQAMVDILQSCSIVLNPVRLQNYSSHNMRSLEAAAAGVFQLATYTYEHAHVLFSEGKSIALYKNPSDLAAKVSWYLAHPEERRVIRNHSQVHIKTYSLQQVLMRFFENDLCFCSTVLEGYDSVRPACDYKGVVLDEQAAINK